MRLTLRVKVMLIAVLPLAVLALTTLWIVNRSITERVQGNIRDDLKRASAVFESMLASRARTLEIETQTIAQDPKFFSVQRDHSERSVRGDECRGTAGRIGGP